MIIKGGKLLHSECEYNGTKTNNYAEYHAIEMALGWCLDNLQSPGSANVSIFSDSELVVRQLNGKYKTKVSKLKDLKKRVVDLVPKFGSVKFGNLPRENAHISRVDRELNRLLDETAGKDL
jgi:ribonuclease HI